MKINKIIKMLYSKSTIKKTQKKINLLGINGKININEYLEGKIIFLTLIFILILFLSTYGYFLAPIITAVLYFLYDYNKLPIQFQSLIRLQMRKNQKMLKCMAQFCV